MHNYTITKTFHRGTWSDQASVEAVAAEWAGRILVLAEASGITVSTKIESPRGVYIVNHIEGRKATATVQFENETDYALFKLKHPDE